MTDLEKTKRLFDELGIGYTETIWEGKCVLELVAGEGKTKIFGYPCFFANFSFEKSGKFLDVVIGE